MDAYDKYMSLPLRERIKKDILHTSVDDAKSSLYHVDDLDLLQELLRDAVAVEGQRKTLIRHIKARIRKVGGKVPEGL